MKALALLIVLGVIVAGCLTHGPPGSPNIEDTGHDPCAPGYFVGCDDNPDALYMLETFGLHQYTNSTERLARPVIDDGHIAWVRGGHGDPVWHHVMSISDGGFYTYQSSKDVVQRGIYISEGLAFISEHPRAPPGQEPRQENFNHSALMLWDPYDDSFLILDKPAGVPLVPAGMGDSWLLTTILHYGVSHRNGVAALNADTGEYVELFPIRPNDSSFFGGPLIDSAIGGDHVFLSMLWAFETGQPNAIIQVDLETGEQKEILNVTGHSIQAMDASEDYFVLQATIDGKSGIWAWSIEGQEWFFVQEGRQRPAIHPKVGGDWVVYLEHRTEEHPSVLVGYHIPTSAYYELVIGEPNPRKASPFEYVTWDTDGHHVVAHINVWSVISTSPFEFRGSQLYWMELPDAESSE